LITVVIFWYLDDNFRDIEVIPDIVSGALHIGAADNISVVIRQTVLQLLTPDSMARSRPAVSVIFIGSSNELGEFESGLAASFLGLVPSVVFGGVMTLVTVGW